MSLYSNIKKTGVVNQTPPGIEAAFPELKVTVAGTVEVVEHFSYVGSH